MSEHVHVWKSHVGVDLRAFDRIEVCACGAARQIVGRFEVVSCLVSSSPIVFVKPGTRAGN